MNVAIQCLFVLSTPGGALKTRVNAGLIVGNRNVGLLWAALGGATTPTMALCFACAQLPIYTLPRIIQYLMPRLAAWLGALNTSIEQK